MAPPAMYMGWARIAEDDETDWMYYLADGLGSVRQLTDDAGVVLLAQGYEPYGSVLYSCWRCLQQLRLRRRMDGCHRLAVPESALPGYRHWPLPLAGYLGRGLQQSLELEQMDVCGGGNPINNS